MKARPTRYAHYLATDDGDVYSTHGGGFHKLSPSRHPRTGHLRVRVFEDHLPRRKNGRCYSDVGVHVLVCEAFHGPRPPGALVRHYPDPDPANNRPDNLAWGTDAENAADRTEHADLAAGQESLAFSPDEPLPGAQTDPRFGF